MVNSISDEEIGPACISQESFTSTWDIHANPVGVSHLNLGLVLVIRLNLCWKNSCLSIEAVPSQIIINTILDTVTELLSGEF